MLIDRTTIRNVYLHADAVDFRKGIIGLGACVVHNFADSTGTKNLFVFCNRQRNKLRILYWDDTGFALWHKSLERDRFKWPKAHGEASISIDQLRWLLAGLKIDREKPHEKTDPRELF